MPKCCELLFIMMKDLIKHADDTIWLMAHETVFERLVEIYRESGGDMNILEKEFPDYPICHESNYDELIKIRSVIKFDSEEDDLFVKSPINGKMISVTAIFNDVEDTNRYLEENTTEGVIMQADDFIFCASVDDLGKIK